MKKAMLVVNPSSGGEKAKAYEKLAKNKLEHLFETVTVEHTKKAGDAKQFARKSAEEQYDSLFMMGGDGTVNEGINGLAEQDHRPNFGFFPLGTVNDLARSLHIPLNPEQAIETLDLSRLKPLDIGKINTDYFMNVVAIGSIPEAISTVDSEDKTKFGKLAYFFSGFKKLMNTQSYTFRLSVDGEDQVIDSSVLLIGSTSSIGGFEQLLPEADVNDGKLHLLYLKDPSLIGTIKAVPELLRGVEHSSSQLEYLTFKEARIELLDASTLTANVDGDEGDALPVTLAVRPSHLQVYYGNVE